MWTISYCLMENVFVVHVIFNHISSVINSTYWAFGLLLLSTGELCSDGLVYAIFYYIRIASLKHNNVVVNNYGCF